ncbi:MAG: RlpA-like double-psi beta-barrel domain-containing protein [Fibrobacter sp.]|nr:RlpA-like double-psi beta-barrel domain-containing protein [Fibrobacter sp.]
MPQQRESALVRLSRKYGAEGAKTGKVFRFVLAVMGATLLVACGSDSPSEAHSSSSVEVSSSSTLFDEPVSSAEEKISSSGLPQSSSEQSSSVQLSSSQVAAESSSSALESSSSKEALSSSSQDWFMDDAGGQCEKCDNYTAQDPELTEIGGKGSVTTYGSITEKETSLGGACNYGQTNIQYYAAIHVNVSSGDDKGPWNGGLACGGCVRVKAKTPEGWKRVTVRITDRCPDESCGVDLGGAPASDVMGKTVGRYYGEWEFVSCEGVKGVWGDSTAVWVKEGAGPYWSIIQIRNPKDAVTGISIASANSSDDGEALKYAIEAENFWTVPQSVLQSDDEIRIVVSYRSGTPDTWLIKGSALTKGEATYYLYEYRE